MSARINRQVNKGGQRCEQVGSITLTGTSISLPPSASAFRFLLRLTCVIRRLGERIGSRRRDWKRSTRRTGGMTVVAQAYTDTPNMPPKTNRASDNLVYRGSWYAHTNVMGMSTPLPTTQMGMSTPLPTTQMTKFTQKFDFGARATSWH
jgi:hypothetical protein